jgi:ribosomal protein S18 acetylase RimI-like enzyme
VTATISLGPLQHSHRSQLEEIVCATGVFSEGEIQVALELFDEAFTADIGTGPRCGAGTPTWDMDRSKAISTPMSDVPSPMSVVRSDYEFIGAFEEDTLIGYVCFGATPSTDRTYDLYWIAVHPKAQRSGAGAALMTEVEWQLEQRGARLVVVETSSRDDYASTRRFYHKRGYNEAARVRDFYSPGDDRVVFSKRLIAARARRRAFLPFPLNAYE